jgi:hypothetical protein
LRNLSLIKTSGEMPKIVSLEWLIDSMMTGKLQGYDEYLIKIDPSIFRSSTAGAAVQGSRKP